MNQHIWRQGVSHLKGNHLKYLQTEKEVFLPFHCKWSLSSKVLVITLDKVQLLSHTYLKVGHERIGHQTPSLDKKAIPAFRDNIGLTCLHNLPY